MYNKKAIEKYREKNKENYLDYQKEYYEKNKEERAKYKKEWYERKKEELKAGKSNFHVNFKIDEEEYKKLKEALERDGLNAADFVRQAIKAYLQK